MLHAVAESDVLTACLQQGWISLMSTLRTSLVHIDFMLQTFKTIAGSQDGVAGQCQGSVISSAISNIHPSLPLKRAVVLTLLGSAMRAHSFLLVCLQESGIIFGMRIMQQT